MIKRQIHFLCVSNMLFFKVVLLTIIVSGCVAYSPATWVVSHLAISYLLTTVSFEHIFYQRMIIVLVGLSHIQEATINIYKSCRVSDNPKDDDSTCHKAVSDTVIGVGLGTGISIYSLLE
ncbi:hypothetical protein DFJ63DRAFT_310697 [Scheffersomyces coipomensis]|uniref:uncharacterized protein n=1 Tax=Scheffersomyces coipomensis TaxID=1788519 RepID=UPI00315DE53C